ncbi:MAG: substrate-binding domain-containing protein [Methylococcaceae bacterium]|nr:substrate-binding domain-containing protein [Prolixibacteraceae bacterium]
MKNISVIIAGLSLFIFSLTGMCNTTHDSPTAVQKQATAANAVNLASSTELSSLANSWANEFGKLNPGVSVQVSDLNSQPAGTGQINLVTDDNLPEGNDQSWKMVVARDAIVFIINANNPMVKEINLQGITADELATLISNPANRNWDKVIANAQSAPVTVYSIDSNPVKENVADFTGLVLSSFNVNTATTAGEIISAVQKDQFAIGICKLTDVRDESTNELVQGIKLLPVDKNKNGRLDSFENIYANMNAFTRGAWVGKYPHALCTGIYAVAASQPTDKNTLSFLSWVTTDGQKLLNKSGYSDLMSAEIAANMALLSGKANEPITNTVALAENKPFLSNVWMVAILIIAISVLVVAAVLRYGKKQNWNNAESELKASPVLKEDAIVAPRGLYFDKTHTWAFMEKDGNVKVGIDDFLQHVTGTLTRVIMKNTGEKIRKGDKILTIVKDGKQLSVYAPISGTIIQQNTSLVADSSLVNSSPYADGWVYLIEPNNWVREMRFLFMGEKYSEWIEDEFIRLKDFFASSLKAKNPAFAHVILQDGGELADNILADLEPEVWEDFQNKFINTSR